MGRGRAAERELGLSTRGEGTPVLCGQGASSSRSKPVQSPLHSPPQSSQAEDRRDSPEEGGDSDAGSDPQSQESARRLKRGRGKNQGTGEQKEERSRGRGSCSPVPAHSVPSCLCVHTRSMCTRSVHTPFTHTYAVCSHQLPLIQTPPVRMHTEVTLSMHKHPTHNISTLSTRPPPMS